MTNEQIVIDVGDACMKDRYALAGNAVHNIYNDPEIMSRWGLKVTEKKHFRLLAPNCYWSVQGRKLA